MSKIVEIKRDPFEMSRIWAMQEKQKDAVHKEAERIYLNGYYKGGKDAQEYFEKKILFQDIVLCIVCVGYILTVVSFILS